MVKGRNIYIIIQKYCWYYIYDVHDLKRLYINETGSI